MILMLTRTATVLLAVVVITTATYADQFDAQQLLEAYLRAIGGGAAWSHVHTVRITGVTRTEDSKVPGPPVEGTFILDGELPTGIHITQNGKIVDNGNAAKAPCGWDPEDQPSGTIRTPPDQIECDATRAPLGPLLYVWSRSIPVERGPDVRWGKRMVPTLRIPFKSGRYYLIYLDPDTHLELRRDYVLGELRVVRTVPSAYTWTHGVAIPAVWEITFDYYPIRAWYVAHRIKVNP